MNTPMELFDYELPASLIATHSVEPRDQARMLVLDRVSGHIQHKHVFDLPAFLQAGDVLVFNNTKVFKARLHSSDGREVFLLKETAPGIWQALLKPGRRFRIGESITLPGPIGPMELLQKNVDGTAQVSVGLSRDAVLRYCDVHGEVPLPPYVQRSELAERQYQTLYATESGAVAAPTAGLHFTTRLLDELKQKGILCQFVTLHVGVGTFRPVQTQTLEAHQMHSEWTEVGQETAGAIARAKQEGRRVVAVGTTVVRALEGTGGKPFSGELNLFITPGFHFRVIDGLMTNFHLPKSTLLALVSAFAGREKTLHAYEEAKRIGYRFYSFGDALFIPSPFLPTHSSYS